MKMHQKKGIYRLKTSRLRGIEMIYKNNSITADEVNKLRHAVAFRQIDEAQIKAGLSGSALVVSAYEDRHAVQYIVALLLHGFRQVIGIYLCCYFCFVVSESLLNVLNRCALFAQHGCMCVSQAVIVKLWKR